MSTPAKTKVSDPYTDGAYHFKRMVVDVWVEVPGYGAFKTTLPKEEVTPKELKRLRTEGGKDIVEVIERLSVTQSKEKAKAA